MSSTKDNCVLLRKYAGMEGNYGVQQASLDLRLGAAEVIAPWNIQDQIDEDIKGS
jgi:hypothetical protein